jgi:ankyrin repeat protein
MHAGSPAVACRLLAAGADVRAVSRQQEDVLQEVLGGAACDAGLCGPERFTVARVLIEHGADMHAVTGAQRHSRLYLAAFRHQADVVDFLLAAGVSARRADPEDGSQPLHGICWQGEYEDPSANAACERIIRALVAAGADVNARDKRGCTPLHEAAGGDWGNATAVRVLLELGAEPDPRNKGRQTPLMLAASRGELACIELLLQAGADPKPALRSAREHHAAWETINRDGVDVASFGQSVEDRARHHREVLAEAAACLDLLATAAREARRPTSSSRACRRRSK